MRPTGAAASPCILPPAYHPPFPTWSPREFWESDFTPQLPVLLSQKPRLLRWPAVPPPPPPPWACATHAAASLPFLSTTQPPVLLDYSSLPTPRGLCTAVPSASDRHLPASFRAFVPQPKCRPSARKASLTSLTSFHPTVLLHFPLSGIVLSTYLSGFSSLSFYHCTLPSASTS